MTARRVSSSLIALLVLALPVAAQKERGMVAPPSEIPAAGPSLLRDGVVLDAERSALYAMRPGGGVLAVRLEDGARLWESDDAARPLAFSGSTLLAEAAGAEEASSLTLSLLDVANRGRLLGRVEIPLDGPVRTLVDDGLGLTFRMQASASPGEAVVLWKAVHREIPGAMLAEEPGAGALPVEESVGGAMVDLSTGRATLLEAATFPDARPLREPAEALRLPGDGPQYLSADDRHIVSSERVAGDPEWNQYRWTVRETTTGRVVGTFDHPVAIAPFAVAGTTIVLETRPFERRLADGSYLRQPLALRGIDLTTGRELWMHELRDVTYYGPFPP